LLRRATPPVGTRPAKTAERGERLLMTRRAAALFRITTKYADFLRVPRK
jgi:hypothetical protein